MEITKTTTTGKTTLGDNVTLNYTIYNDKDGKPSEVNGSIDYDGSAIGYLSMKADKFLTLNISQKSDITKDELTEVAKSFINDAFDAFEGNEN